MIEIVGTPEFAGWFESLAPADAEAVTRAITVLEEVGAETPRAREVTLPPMLRARGPARLFELDASGGRVPLVVYFVHESGRVVLLWGTEVERGRRGDLPVIANHLLACRVWWENRKQPA